MSKSIAALFVLAVASQAFAIDPGAVTALRNGDLAIMDSSHGIAIVSGANAPRSIVRDFRGAVASDLTPLGDTLLVTLNIREKAASFSRLAQYDLSGKKIAEWALNQPGGILAGVAVDPAGQFVYCTDARLGQVYRADLRSKKPSLDFLTKIRDAAILGPLVVDAKKRRLLVADVQTGRIYAVPFDAPRTGVSIVNEGTLVEAVAMSIDPATDTLYIADAARRRIWTGSTAADRISLKSMQVSQSFGAPSSVSVASGGSVWVGDRRRKRVWLFASDGRTLRTVIP